MGRYIPPDQEGTTSGNQIHKKGPPGALRKDGTQTVRFEMPFATWCHHCRPHAIIGQGVRFNAKKKKVGYYHSTPIWSFRIKHVTCGGAIEIRTDPQNTAYVVVEGGKARDYGEEKVREGEGGVPILSEAERERRREDAFARLEGKVEEKEVGVGNAKRVEDLYRASERDWEDPWGANRRMRTAFRRERKVRKREEEKVGALKERLGTEMEILGESEGDARRARLVDFAADQGDGDAAAAGDVFERRAPSRVTATSSPRNPATLKESRAEALRQRLVGNTRAAMNPFGKDL